MFIRTVFHDAPTAILRQHVVIALLKADCHPDHIRPIYIYIRPDLCKAQQEIHKKLREEWAFEGKDTQLHTQ